MESLIQSHPDKVKAIGVANYSVKYLEKLLAQATITPAANQIENHPLLPQQEIVDFCKEKGIHITAYSPLGSTGSPLFKDEGVLAVAEKHKVGPATVLLSYHRACPVPLLSLSFPLPLYFFIFEASNPLSLSLLTSCTVARNSSVLAKSVTPSRIDENRKLISLDADELEQLEAVQKKNGPTRYVYPPFGVDVGFADKPGGVDLSG
jgi:glycerol 2-dehydrogenase (NADP+)